MNQPEFIIVLCFWLSKQHVRIRYRKNLFLIDLHQESTNLYLIYCVGCKLNDRKDIVENCLKRPTFKIIYLTYIVFKYREQRKAMVFRKSLFRIHETRKSAKNGDFRNDRNLLRNPLMIINYWNQWIRSLIIFRWDLLRSQLSLICYERRRWKHTTPEHK